MNNVQKYDYIGGIVDGEVRGEPLPPGTSKTRQHYDFKGLYSGQNTTNWRYNSMTNTVWWNVPSEPHSKELLKQFLEKRGITNYKEKSMYTNVSEGTHDDQPYGGWMDTDGKFHEVNYEQHREWARQYLGDRGITTFDNSYTELYKMGFIRVVIGGSELYYNYYNIEGKRIPPTQKQMKSLKDLAIEQGCQWIHDSETNKVHELLEEGVINEVNAGIKFWWMGPDLQLYPVPFEQHRYWAETYLEKKGFQHTVDVYLAMYRLGFVRVVKQRYTNELVLSFQYENRKTLSEKQLKALKDLAIEEECDWIQDDTTGKERRLKEIRLEQPIDESVINLAMLFLESSRKQLLKENSSKENFIKSRIPHLTDDTVIITVNPIPELPEASYVQVDEISGGRNIFSSNPETLTKLGYPLPPSQELLKLPRGKYSVKQLKAIKASHSLNENMTYEKLLSLTTPERKERAGDVNVRNLPVSVEENQEQWNFRYKSSPQSSVTDKPFRGTITFLKGNVNNRDNAMKLECKVDCECPDYMYRFAYNNTKQNASQIGPDSLNKAINRPPKPAYDVGEGLCKHLAALRKYLQTKLTRTKKSNLFEAVDEIAKQGPFNVTYED